MLEAQIMAAALDNRNRLSMTVEFRDDGVVMETQEFTFSMSDYPDLAALKADGLEMIDDVLARHMVRLWGEARNTGNLSDLITQAVGYTRSMTSTIIDMDGEQWEVFEDGTYTVL
jgi:hypothetical protein